MVLERRRSGNTDLPGILFNDNGHYELKLEVFSKCADEGKQEFLTEVNVLRTEQQASFSVGKDSVGCTDDPDPFVITLNNLSEGVPWLIPGRLHLSRG